MNYFVDHKLADFMLFASTLIAIVIRKESTTTFLGAYWE